MTWRETSRESEQNRFIRRWLGGGVTVTDLAREFGVSRKTAHKRINRFREHGFDGLGDWSRAPHNHPNKTPWEAVERIIEAKGRWPSWGPKKLVPWLRGQHPGLDLPAVSTVGSILKDAGLVRSRRRVQRTEPWTEPFRQAKASNDVWCVDLKGWFRTGDGTRCDPLTISDASTRFLLACRILDRPRHEDAKRVFVQVFREYGLPCAIRSDNGPPFASTGLGSLSRLSVWWVKLGIMPERIEPGHPEQNGRLERTHRTIREDALDPPEPTRRAQRLAFGRMWQEYNFERPHEALGQLTPASLYRPSPRPYPSRTVEPEYSGSTVVRRVRTNGEIKWRGGMVFLSEALRGEPVGLKQEDERFWRIVFGPLSIGRLDSFTRKVLRTPVNVLPMSPV